MFRAEDYTLKEAVYAAFDATMRGNEDEARSFISMVVLKGETQELSDALCLKFSTALVHNANLSWQFSAMEQTLRAYESAIETIDAKDIVPQIQYYSEVGQYYVLSGNTEKAEELLLNAVKLADEYISKYRDTPDVTLRLIAQAAGDLAKLMADDDAASDLLYGLLDRLDGMDYASLDVKYAQANLLVGIGAMLIREEDYETAKQFYTQAYTNISEVITEEGDAVALSSLEIAALCVDGLSLTYILLNDIKKVQEQFEIAEDIIERITEISDKHGQRFKALFKWGYGVVYGDKESLEEAISIYRYLHRKFPDVSKFEQCIDEVQSDMDMLEEE